MMKPRKQRRAKRCRRKGCRDAIARMKANEVALETKLRRAIDAKDEALYKLRETEAVTECLLRGRLTVYTNLERLSREAKLAIRYTHRQCYITAPETAFLDLGALIGSEPPHPCTEPPRTYSTPEIHVGVEGTVNYALSRDYPDTMYAVESCVRVLGERIAHLILKKFMEQQRQ